MKLTSCETITDFITYGKSLDISHSKLYLKSTITANNKKIIFNSTSFGNKYLPLILEHCTDITLTDKELILYRYKPKLYCWEKYETMELWSLLLKINNMISLLDFNKKDIKVFNNDIDSVINEILIIESDNITTNANKVKK
jgi:hypothetical protein